ncbi:serpin family protein [bacterium]|nr:serpin family protein [bacterium]
MKKFMILFTVFAMFCLVSCGGSSKDEDKTDTGDTTVDTGDTQTDPTDTGDTNPDPTDTGDTNPDPTDTGDTDPADTGDTEEGSWEAKYQKADDHAAAVSKDVVKANNDLGMKIFSKLAATEAGKNMMISPLSISIAMAMVSNGASGDNIAEMKEVLGFGDMEFSEINAQFADLIQSLVAADKDLALEIANSVWMDDVFAPDVKQDFINVLTEFYDAAFFTEDFQDEAAADKINSWVSEKTHGKIDKIIEKIGPNAVMYLINALYFKAAWTTSFDKDSTSEGIFMLSDGTQGKADYMGFAYDQEVPEFYSYSADWSDENGYSVVRIPYGRDVFAFYGIVPGYSNKTNIDDFIAKIAENGIDSYFSQLEKRDFPIQLPKYKFAYEKSLVDVFKSLGMEKAFVDGALMNIAGEPHAPFISDIYHKTFIEVNEEGTEAAAVTSVEVGDNGMPAGFFADRPFVFIIRDDRTGSILFVGKVENPKAE